jgi:hypothetical protein
MPDNLPNIGDRIIVHGMRHFQSVVHSIEWSDEISDWQINLDWGEHGRSRVWLRDENSVWFRYTSSN